VRMVEDKDATIRYQIELIGNLERQVAILESTNVEQCSTKIQGLIKINDIYREEHAKQQETIRNLTTSLENCEADYRALRWAFRVIQTTVDGISVDNQDERCPIPR